jgi:hypothetical protein
MKIKGDHRMKDRRQTSAPVTTAATDYQKTIRVSATPDALFDALTSVSGISAWWAPATGSGEVDGDLKFLMNFPEPMLIHVDQATRAKSVQWTVTECPFPGFSDWVGTRPTFTITSVDGDVSELHFRHHGLTSELDCIDICTTSWNSYMASLRDYVEGGQGAPLGSSADQARRVRDGDDQLLEGS